MFILSGKVDRLILFPFCFQYKWLNSSQNATCPLCRSIFWSPQTASLLSDQDKKMSVVMYYSSIACSWCFEIREWRIFGAGGWGVGEMITLLRPSVLKHCYKPYCMVYNIHSSFSSILIDDFPQSGSADTKLKVLSVENPVNNAL